MKALSGKELARILERHGWNLMRVHGSHHIYGKKGSRVRLSVPVQWKPGSEEGAFTPPVQDG